MRRLLPVVLSAAAILAFAALPASAAAGGHPHARLPFPHHAGVVPNSDANDQCWADGGEDCLHVSGPANDDVVRTEPYTYNGGYMAFQFDPAIGWYPGTTVSDAPGNSYPFTVGSNMNAEFHGDLIVVGGFTNIVNNGGNGGCIGVDSATNYVDVLERPCLFGKGATLVLSPDPTDFNGNAVISVASSDHYDTPQYLSGGSDGQDTFWVQPLSTCGGPEESGCFWGPGNQAGPRG